MLTKCVFIHIPIKYLNGYIVNQLAKKIVIKFKNFNKRKYRLYHIINTYSFLIELISIKMVQKSYFSLLLT